MTAFDEFRVLLTPDLATQGTWSVMLTACPVAGLTGLKGTAQPTVSRDQLIELRSRHGWPNVGELRAIGGRVWESVMTPKLEAAFIACLTQSPNLRLVVSMIDERPAAGGPAGPGQIRMQELPLEALHSDLHHFLAVNPATPISRSLKFEPDRDPPRLPLPLRALVVVAAPKDKPGGADIQAEKDALASALTGLTGPGGAIVVEYCDPPTIPELQTRLQNGRFHILHFIGHGGFAIVGQDPSPRPHLCLQRESDGKTDELDADTLESLLFSNDVRLVIMTACSSAAPTPDEEPYHAHAFDGLAQRLVGSASSVSAVVAMQFDLESEAAVVFSKTFYKHLLQPSSAAAQAPCVDEIVTRCRQALIAKMKAGHRAWVTPVVYWRCKQGQVFDIQALRRAIDPDTQRRLTELEVTRGVYQKAIADTKAMPADQQALAAPLVAQWVATVEDLEQQRSQLLGDTVRLRGGVVKPGDTLGCSLGLRLRTAGVVGDVSIRVRYPAGKVAFQGAALGVAGAGSMLLTGAPAPGECLIVVQNASHGAQWPAGEYELAVANFRVEAGVADPLLELAVVDAQVQQGGAAVPAVAFEALSAILFIT